MKTMKIKLLGLNCSPRENSNSGVILEASLSDLKKKYDKELEYEIVNLKDYKINHCLACDVCGKTKNTGKFIPCVQDDETGIVLEKMLKADGFLVATPVYFGLASDLFSKFIMRLRVVRHQDFALTNKVVAIIAIAARRSGGAETTITSSWLPFIRNGCLIVGNGDKTCQFGTMGWAGARGHILTDEWGVKQANSTAERAFHVAKLVKAGTEILNYSNYMRFCYKSGTRH
jgi:multimeric flavodoxin WrbA